MGSGNDVLHQWIIAALASRARARQWLLADERHSRSCIELPAGDRPGIGTPVHRTGDDAAVALHLLNDANMSQPGCPLYPALQDNDRSYTGSRGDAPAILIGSLRPLPRVGVAGPGNIGAVQVMVALICIPRACSIWKCITGDSRCYCVCSHENHRRSWSIRSSLRVWKCSSIVVSNTGRHIPDILDAVIG